MKQILKARDERATKLKRSKGTTPSEGRTEDEVRVEERESIKALIGETGNDNLGTNPSGMYELSGERDERRRTNASHGDP